MCYIFFIYIGFLVRTLINIFVQFNIYFLPRSCFNYSPNWAQCWFFSLSPSLFQPVSRPFNCTTAAVSALELILMSPPQDLVLALVLALARARCAFYCCRRWCCCLLIAIGGSSCCSWSWSCCWCCCRCCCYCAIESQAIIFLFLHFSVQFSWGFLLSVRERTFCCCIFFWVDFWRRQSKATNTVSCLTSRIMQKMWDWALGESKQHGAKPPYRHTATPAPAWYWRQHRTTLASVHCCL